LEGAVSQTVERAISIVEHLARRPATLIEVTAELGVHKSTALRLLQTLEGAGFARRQTDGLYTVGVRLISIAYSALESLDLREVARPHLTPLNQKYGHTVHLASFVDGVVIYIDKYEGRSSIRMYSRVGKTVDFHSSGVGKVILANLDPALRETVISRVAGRARGHPRTRLRLRLWRVRRLCNLHRCTHSIRGWHLAVSDLDLGRQDAGALRRAETADP